MKTAIITALLLVMAQPLADEQVTDSTTVTAGQEFLLRAAEYAGYQIAATNRLSGQRLDWTLANGTSGSITIAANGLINEFHSATTSTPVSAQVFELADELIYASFPLDDGRRAKTLILDRHSGRVMEIESRRPEPAEGTHRAQVQVLQGRLNTVSIAMEPLPVTEKMAGVRLTARYSDEITYEHIYLNPHRVTWHGVTGPEAGVADTEYYDAYQVRENVFLVSWSEKILTTHMIFLFNFATNHEIGTIFGYEPEHNRAVVETIGAETEVLQGPSG